MGNLRLNWVRYRVRVYTIWLLKVNVGKSRGNVTKDIEELTTQLECKVTREPLKEELQHLSR